MATEPTSRMFNFKILEKQASFKSSSNFLLFTFFYFFQISKFKFNPTQSNNKDWQQK